MPLDTKIDASLEHYQYHTGARDSVWVHKDPVTNRPQFPTLKEDIETDICIIGCGISGISTAYELVTRGKEVVMVEARDVLAGNTSRTSGHLNNDLDDGFAEIQKKHGESGAKIAAESHGWALDRIGEISKKLGIDCEYRKLPSYNFSQYPRGHPKRDDEIKELKEEAEWQKKVGIQTEFKDGLAVKGWNGNIDQRDGMIVKEQATFHPTKYLNGVLKWLKQQPNFKCYTHTRVLGCREQGIELLGMGHKTVLVETEAGNKIQAEYAVEATDVPLQKLSIIAEMEYKRSYCIAIRVPKGSVEDCLIYDQAENYKYVRLTECDEKDDYMVVGGCDHETGQEETLGRFEELEQWTRERFPQAGTVDYKWSGQVYDPVDFMGFVGKNQGNDKIFVITGDSGDGLTNGVMAGRLIADEVMGVENPWAQLYNPSRMMSIAKSLNTMIPHDVKINKYYKRFLQSDIQDIEDLAPGCGGVLNATGDKPIAVYKDETGNVTRRSAICPHMKGVVCWNKSERSWDCPVHGSRFSPQGVCVDGPSKANLGPADETSIGTESDHAAKA
jgi:glycine/D-amino acid oxidase-like deaminating enzyme/nitrite reductase/ring-hydroxylating ferredoxin subunit